MSYHCNTTPMENRMETPWSECCQDQASWCLQHQDELHTPILSNQCEFNYSFDDQSMYNPILETNPFTVDLKEEEDLLPLPFTPEEDNNNSILADGQGARDNGMRYSVNYVVSGIDQDSDNILSNWNINTSTPCINPDTITSNKIPNIPPSEETMFSKQKPQLKLDIAAANAKLPLPSDAVIPSIVEVLDTPDVTRILYNPLQKFSLVDLFGAPDDQSLMPAVDPNSIIQPRPKECKIAKSQKLIKIDHDYAESLPSSSAEPMPTENITFNIIEDVKPQLPVKEEPYSPSPSTSTSLGKRVRKTFTEHDFIYEDDSQSDNSSDWSPLKKKSKVGKKKVAEISRTRNPSFSDTCSVSSGPDKYRELRDKNNEASRRSRLNRKQKEIDMITKANNLESENRRLRSTAEKLELEVKKWRKIIMKLIKDKRKV